VLLLHQDLELARALHPLIVGAVEHHHRLVVRHLLLLLELQEPLCHRHQVVLPLHLLLVLLVPL